MNVIIFPGPIQNEVCLGCLTSDGPEVASTCLILPPFTESKKLVSREWRGGAGFMCFSNTGAGVPSRGTEVYLAQPTFIFMVKESLEGSLHFHPKIPVWCDEILACGVHFKEEGSLPAWSKLTL